MAWTAEQRREYLQSRGFIAPDNDGFFVEAGQAAAQSFVSAARGVGATINELTGNSSMQDYFQGVLNRNQQWNAPEDGSVGSYIGRAVGSAAGSTVATLTAATAGTLLGGPGAGVAAGVTTAFAQTFGDNVQRNREAGYSDDKALGMAFLESGIDAAIENLPFGIVGKSGKVIAQAGRLRNISAAGKRELLNAVGKRVAAATGQKETQSTLARLGKAAFMNGLGEGGEEGLQTLNSYLNQTLGGDTRANITIEELADSIAQGFIGGFFLGGAQNTPMLFTSVKRGNAVNIQGIENADATDSKTQDTQALQAPELFDTLISEVGGALGINIDFMDSRPDGAKLEEKNNGIYDKDNKTLYLNRKTYSVNPAETLGHELKHYIDDNVPELSKAFDSLLEAGKNDAGRQEVAEIVREFGITETEGNEEFSADIFGKLFARPETWQKMATQLDEQTPGMGEKFLQTLRDFYTLVKTKLADLVGTNPEAETFLDNVTELENEAARMLAELRRQNGNASQVENVVGAKGNTAVETVPVADINVDAERFQFKSNTNKSSGVNESNKLGGDWDPRTAGNLYLWQDKSGKMYVVNGHHRLELARRNNVENLNAIIDRETDGVTAEQARRNGVLINIRDGQGDVRDYAAFVRSEKLSEDEAKSQGVTARQKGRAGFALGKSGDTLYEAYRNEEIPESKAVIIAEVAQGNEAIEYAGIRLAVDRKLAGEVLRQTLKLAAQNSSGGKSTAVQGSLFDMVDDTVLREWELMGKAAATHIKEIRTRIEAAKDAIKNPEAAKSLGVKTTKGAEKLLAQAQEELARWENYATNPELMAQLRQEANIAPQEFVAGAKNAQTSDTVETGSAVDAPVVKDKLTTEKAATPKENLAVASDGSDGREVTEVAPEKDPTVDDFLLRFAPQLDAIIAKNTIKARGNLYDDNLKSFAMTAAAKAYEDFEPGKGASLDTLASTYVENAVIDFNRKQYREFERSGGDVSLQMENDQGNTLEDTLASDEKTRYYDEVSAREDPESAKRRILESKKLSPLQKKIVDLLNQGYPRSVVIRKLGMQFGEEGHEYMSPEEFQRRLKNIRAIIAQEGVRYSRKREQNIEDVNQKFNEDIDRQIAGTLPKGYIHQLGMPGDILLSTGVPDLPIELSSSHLDKKSKQENHPFDIADLKNLPKMLQNPIAVFLYGDKDQAQNIIIEVQRDGKNFLVGLSFNFEHDGLIVNSIRGLFAKETVFWLRWIEQGKTLYIDKEKVQKLIAQQQTNFADVDNLDLNSINNIIQNFKNPSPDLQFSRKRIFTGSAASYDKPSLQYVGTGEGQQAYGWGLYGSESEKVARWYAEEDADRKNHSIATVIKYMGTPYTEKELFDDAKAGDADVRMLAHVFSRGGVQNAIHELEQQIERAKQKNWHPELYEWQEDLLKDIKDAQDDIEYLGNSLEGKRHLYNQTFWPTQDEDLLDWNDVLTDEQRDKILKQGSKEGVFKLDRTEQPQEVLNALQAIRDEIQYDDQESSFFYEKLSTVLGSPKAASEFLYRAGIDGITYIGDSSGVRNYVAFSDKDIQVDEHIQFSRKRSSEQINPVVVDGKVREEYADLLSERKYTVQTLKALQAKALEWIKRNGGVVPSVQALLKDSAPADPAVAEIARRMLLNSEVFAESVSRVDRTKLYEMEQDIRSDWGRAGRAMQLAALKLNDVASVQAVLNKLHKDMKDTELLKLRNQIKDELDVDIFNLPDDIVENKSKLDAVLRKHLTHAANIGNKFYEYYINAILSGPTTHISNLLGNTANAVYELGIKRFTEALVNIAAGRKDGATFGEFRQMAKAFNWRNAWEAAKKSFDLEVLDPAGKYLENNNVAIGGTLGRFIRTPGRALKAADAFAKALIEPVETVAYAYRMGVQQGISDRELAVYIQKQLADSDSDAYQWGKQRSRELTFQENPGDVVNRLMALRESGGAMGTALKIFLPFIKTPYNILRQGIRKGPVGTLNLAMEFGKVAMGKRKFDGEMVARIAEQLLAWGTFMVFYGLSDDDDLPLLTGTSSAYGSAEYGFKANKIPPYSIRLGNTWYSYQRIEPLATGLAAIADGIQAIRNVRNGKDATRAMTETIGATLKVIGEKSFLDSIGEIIKVVEDPERNAMRPATNLIASAMPALIRQTRQAFIEEVGESKSRNMGAEWWKDQFDLIINRAGITTAIPKVDYFGRDVKKDDWSTSMLSDAGRLLPIKRVEADRNMGNAERLIWNYNRRNPDEEYYPNIPRNTFTHNGVKMYFAGDDYRDFAVQSGQLAHKQINNAIRAGRLNVENPTEKDIKLIRKIFTRARKETQDKLLQQKRGNQL